MNIVRLRKKLPSFLILPLLVLLAYAFYSVYTTFEKKILYTQTYKYIHFTIPASNLIHELQKERGYSSTYIVTSGEAFSKELQEQRKLTDKQVKEFKTFLQEYSCDTCTNMFKEKVNRLFESLRLLNLTRSDIDDWMLEKEVEYYTDVINQLINLVEYIIPISHDNGLISLTQSYVSIIKIKEKAGLERALISKVLGKGRISHDEFYILGTLITSQNIYSQLFTSIASQKYLDYFQTMKKAKEESFESIEKERRKLYSKSQRNEILSSIKEYIGYGGLIHNFKNYVIRGDNKYLIAAKKDYKLLLNALEEYRILEGTSSQEIKELDMIKNTFSAYINNLDKVTIAYEKNVDIHTLDKNVKIDDKPALKALHNLTINIYGSPTYWFKVSTQRIDVLHQLELYLAEDMTSFVKDKNDALIFETVIKLILLVIIVVIIISSLIMLKELIESAKMLNRAQENTRSGSYEYYFDDDFLVWSDEYYKLLEVDKKDFNLNMKSLMSFIHKDDLALVKQSVKEAIRSKKIVFAEYRVVLKSKNTMHVRSSFEVIKYDIAGKAKIIVGTMTDISGAKKLEQEIVDTQKDVIFTMGAIGESRSQETGEHVKRVAEYSKLLALLHGESEEDAELLKMASPMHDIGKVGIPDKILNKPGKLTPDEWKIMQTHAELGYEMLKNSDRKILRVAATVALSHHESYDGSGYPLGLEENKIPLVGRITALADVFDALGSDRCYKKAWDLEKILEFIRDEKAKKFDPVLVELFLENLDKFLAIRENIRPRS